MLRIRRQALWSEAALIRSYKLKSFGVDRAVWRMCRTTTSSPCTV
jgi:hypothetical protein